MHGFLTGKYSSPTTFEPGDFRENIDAFKDQGIIDKIKQNTDLLKKRFTNHPNPVMHGVIDTLISDSENSCVLLGMRNVQQVNAAISLGDQLQKEDVDWVKQLYTKNSLESRF
jgi:aryl-alcohol dehydrogenase-like predicted oxidoreductase